MAKITETVRISRSNYQQLIRVKGYMEAKDGKQYTIDDALSQLLKDIPTYRLLVDQQPLGQRKEGSSSPNPESL